MFQVQVERKRDSGWYIEFLHREVIFSLMTFAL